MKIIQHLCLLRELKSKIAKSHGRLYRMAYAWGHDPDLAQDLAQETMEKALKQLSQLRDPEKLDSWMFGILNNCWHDHFRRQRNLLDINDITELKHEDTPEALHDRQDIVSSVRYSIARLPANQRYVVTLVDIEGFSYAEVATILDIPTGTVMSRLSRARKQLANYLLDYKVETQAKPTKLRRIV